VTSYLEQLFSLGGRVAVVTGGSSGIGRGIALALGQAGAAAVLVARDEEKLRATVADLRAAGCQAAWVSADLGDRAAVDRAAQEAAAAIRSRLSDVHDAETAGRVRILYGGSVKPGSIAPIMAEPDVDGALVGGASLDAGQFAQICRYRELAA